MATTANDAARRRVEPVAAGPTGPRRRRWITLIPLLVLLVVVAALVVVRVQSHPTAGRAPDVTAQVVAAATSVPAAVLDTVGTGGVNTVPIAINGATVSNGRLPRVLWTGAEFCPTCAVMRWPLVIALSRFGTFSGLALTSSSDREVYPGTATLTFRNTTFRSDYLSFTPYETAGTTYTDGHYDTVQTPTVTDQGLIATYDAPPYFASGGAVPFVLYAGQYASDGPMFTPAVLDGLSHTDVAAALSDPTSAAGRAIDGAANVISAVLCASTGNRPGAVCRSSAVAAGRAILGIRATT